MILESLNEARNLSQRYGETPAVDDLSFRVEAGQVTGFLGPNGSGKSTTMRMIVDLDSPTSGAVTVGGRTYGSIRLPLHEVGALLDTNAAVGILAAGAGLTLYELSTQRASLEDAFMELTHRARRVPGYDQARGSEHEVTQVLVPPAVPSTPDARLSGVFLAAIRSEWTKLRTVRSTMCFLVLTGYAVATLAIASFLLVRRDS